MRSRQRSRCLPNGNPRWTSGTREAGVDTKEKGVEMGFQSSKTYRDIDITNQEAGAMTEEGSTVVDTSSPLNRPQKSHD